ncbi:ferric reductase-like transmembrane domain-containing protein [Candidatus Cyanaurora vandensis]|uniref:ferric reductase-like transmembrane domain-containing protein n=1 Tax=Candidatus Cyanaurora vandensis TaxID=2714958 RepID=UPI00257BA55A|nr:ferric reductase-like transmembrane domain-containing protein [Candidatus Cyanaurora vandensis]
MNPAFRWAWFGFTLALGIVWLTLLCLPFLNAGDHLWQQEVTAYQGNLALVCLGLILLAVPLRSWLPALLQDRRWLGLLVFGFALAHTINGFTHTLGGDLAGWQFLGPTEQVALGLGTLALIFLFILALTSNSTAVTALGTAWKKLHRLLFYPTLILILIHTLLWGVNYAGWVPAVLLIAGTVGLVGLRWWPKGQ